MEILLSTRADQVPSERQQLTWYGLDLIFSFGEVLATGIIYGIHIVLTLAAITILWRRKGGMKHARVILGVSVVILYLLATTDLCCTMVYLVAGVQHLLVNNIGTSFRPRNHVYLHQFHTLMEMHSVLFPVAFVIGDAIVVWRACALSGWKKQVILLLGVFQLAVTGTAFGWIGCFVAEGMPFEDSKCRPILLATYAISIATNIVATMVIGYTTWSNWEAIREYLKLSHRPVRAERVTVLLLESGFFYALLLIIQFLFEVIPDQDSNNEYELAREIFWKISTLLVGIYPTALIVLIYLDRSLWDTDGVPSLHLDSTGDLEMGSSHPDPRQMNSEHVDGQAFYQDHTVSGNGPPPFLFIARKRSDYE
ncbi:hypothetical protein PM082_000017 [Marasmius tenuissimus]|nr:hypothetical protein PM082_000017 [Marasmius tenuissimus]